MVHVVLFVSLGRGIGVYLFAASTTRCAWTWSFDKIVRFQSRRDHRRFAESNVCLLFSRKARPFVWIVARDSVSSLARTLVKVILRSSPFSTSDIAGPLTTVGIDAA